MKNPQTKFTSTSNVPPLPRDILVDHLALIPSHPQEQVFPNITIRFEVVLLSGIQICGIERLPQILAFHLDSTSFWPQEAVPIPHQPQTGLELPPYPSTDQIRLFRGPDQEVRVGREKVGKIG